MMTEQEFLAEIVMPLLSAAVLSFTAAFLAFLV